MNLKIVNSIENIELETIIRDHVTVMNASGNFQWSTNYPHVSDFQKDIDNGNLYGIFLNEELLALVALTTNYEKHYYDEDHTFKFSNEQDNILYIHRMVKLTNHRIANFGQKMLKCICENLQNQYDAIQVDTNQKNIPMMRAIESAGFIKTGEFYRSEFISPNWNCYEYVKGEK